jgi:hypothetical protein
VLRTAGETETTKENIQDWFELDEGDPGFWLLKGRNCCSDFFLFIFISTTYVIKFSIYLVSKYSFCLLELSFASLIQIIS